MTTAASPAAFARYVRNLVPSVLVRIASSPPAPPDIGGRRSSGIAGGLAPGGEHMTLGILPNDERRRRTRVARPLSRPRIRSPSRVLVALRPRVAVIRRRRILQAGTRPFPRARGQRGRARDGSLSVVPHVPPRA